MLERRARTAYSNGVHDLRARPSSTTFEHALPNTHYGSSDHATYMQHGIPAVIFNTWPDPWYRSSQDTPDKLDPTQFKRAAVVSIGAMRSLPPRMIRWPSASRPTRSAGRGGGPQSAIPGHMGGEVNALLGRGLTVLEIRDFISGEFEPVPLQDVWDYVRALEAAGSVKLTAKSGR